MTREKAMKRLIVYAGALAIVVGCSKPSVGAANGFVAANSELARPVATAGPVGASLPAAGATREITLPAGTVLPVTLETSVGSDISHVEQPVHGRLRHAVTLHGVQVLPAGTSVSGHVTAARRPGRVKGRGYVAMRFTRIDAPGQGVSRISTSPVSRLAPATKEKDALEILAPAAGGAVIGGLAGGKTGAVTGAAIGGAAGTGYVLSTRGKEVRISKGAPLSIRLTQPVTVRVSS
jgi:hypothetical protein